MSERITIIVGTMTGTSEIVAEDVKSALEEEGHRVEVVLMDGLDGSVFSAGDYIVCTSTYGQGDVPDNAQGLYEDLSQSRPDLSAVTYGVIALGDSTYADTFCDGGRKFDSLLAELGARRLGERLEHDASGPDMPEDAGVTWAREWVETLSTAKESA